MDNEETPSPAPAEPEHIATTEDHAAPPAPAVHTSSPAFAQVEKVTAWALIVSAILFAVVGLLSIWGAFGGNTEVVWRSLGSLAVIAFASLVINVGVRIVDNKK